MNSRILVVAVIASFSLVAHGFAVEPVEGAFGKKFGEKFSVGISPIARGPRAPFRSAAFKPENPLPGLDAYSVSVTPASHRIFEIAAMGTLSSADAVQSLLAMLEEKYGPFSSESQAEVGTLAYAHRAGGQIVHLAVHAGNKVVLTFRDGALTAAARDEGATTKAAEPRKTP